MMKLQEAPFDKTLIMREGGDSQTRYVYYRRRLWQSNP
jgi:hypothetical protein